jgi:hypothetical protein
VATLSHIIKSIDLGHGDLVLTRNYPTRKMAGGNALLSHKHVLAKYCDEVDAFVVVYGIQHKAMDSLQSKGLLIKRDFDSYGLHECYELAEHPRYDDLVARGCKFELDYPATYVNVSMIDGMAGKYGYRLKSLRAIKAFKLEPDGTNPKAKELKNPYIHGIYRISDLDYVGWVKMITETLKREGVIREKSSK